MPGQLIFDTYAYGISSSAIQSSSIHLSVVNDSLLFWNWDIAAFVIVEVAPLIRELIIYLKENSLHCSADNEQY